MKPRWVIDTNVLVSAALTRGGTCRKIIQAAGDSRIELAWDALMLAEYRDVLKRPRFGLSRNVVTELLALFQMNWHTTPATNAPKLPDPEDEVFLAVALATPDRILVTGNTKHYPPARRGGAEVITPAQALARLPT
jgi:putative PIN family toxin of toxin-antitoxin system